MFDAKMTRRTFAGLLIPAAAALALPKFAFAAPGKVVAFINLSVQITFMRTASKGVENAVKAAGGTFIEYDSQNDAQRQLNNMQDAISRKVDGIVLWPTDSQSAAAALGLANRAGIPCVIGDIGTTGGEYVAMIEADNYLGAKDVGKAMAKYMTDKGWNAASYGIIAISQARINGRKRTQGFRDAMTEAGFKEVGLLQMQTATADETFKFTQDILTANPDLRGLFIETDQPAMGALRAIKVLRREGEIAVGAFDGIPDFVPALTDKRIVAAGMQQPYLYGKLLTEALLGHLDGKTVEKQIPVPILAVTGENVQEMLPEIRQNVFGE